MISLMLFPFIACLILSGIYVYFGTHIVKRELIFVDLALAQIAVLGSLVPNLFGWENVSIISYGLSILFIGLGSWVFSSVDLKKFHIHQEAFIGIIYVISAACSILMVSKSTAEAESIKEMLVGNILFISVTEVLILGGLCTCIGVFHYLFRNNFNQLTLSYGTNRGVPRSKKWDFLFYISFGLVVTYSVKMAGILLIFSFLIIPAIAAQIFCKIFNTRASSLLIAWTLSFLGSVLGIYVSAQFDLPTGASIVTTLGLVFFIVLTVGQLTYTPKD
ncbi:metal ABC transporter permease [bacterium]|jgi:zinc/manganese transport system permease protein|nr:metal ABC transporter permease [bacterium]